jgi:hypothetical protein
MGALQMPAERATEFRSDAHRHFRRSIASHPLPKNYLAPVGVTRPRFCYSFGGPLPKVNEAIGTRTRLEYEMAPRQRSVAAHVPAAGPR